MSPPDDGKEYLYYEGTNVANWTSDKPEVTFAPRGIKFDNLKLTGILFNTASDEDAMIKSDYAIDLDIYKRGYVEVTFDGDKNGKVPSVMSWKYDLGDSPMAGLQPPVGMMSIGFGSNQPEPEVGKKATFEIDDMTYGDPALVASNKDIVGCALSFDDNFVDSQSGIIHKIWLEKGETKETK